MKKEKSFFFSRKKGWKRSEEKKSWRICCCRGKFIEVAMVQSFNGCVSMGDGLNWELEERTSEPSDI